ncbi:MAG: PTS sugar transporter subunit IIA [Bacteroidota bacterium]|nr:PTS sugar transporter subunit IIA [Bacteroidota bacterium]
MKICDLLKENLIIPEFEGTSKEDVINELIDLFKADERIDDLEKVRTAVLDREKIMSTGVGKGFAIPHGKTNAINEIIAAFGKTKNPIDYQALDNQPVNLIFLLVGKDNLISTHIKLLSRISRMMNNDDFRNKLLEAKDQKEILSIFQAEEANYYDV